MTVNPEKIPLSLYIHLPWCVKKCPYCDFNSHQAGETLPETAYLNALKRDLDTELPFVQGRSVNSIFIGGGTPSLFSANTISDLLAHVQSVLPLAPNCEITLEANPGTFEQAKFQGFREAGINRLSIGVQSFCDRQLQKLGRIHSAKQARKAILTAKSVGFTNFNIDLMYALPEQTCKAALTDLSQAIELTPTHISWYQLTIEPNTIFYKTRPKQPTDDSIAEFENQGKSLLNQAGFSAYEISAYAKPHHQCQHNRNYWLFGDYLAIGAGAHSKVTTGAAIFRRRKVRQPNRYLNPTHSQLAEQKPIPKTELALEFMLNALRLREPIPFDWLTKTTGLTRHDLRTPLAKAQEFGLLTHNHQTFELTPRGELLTDNVIQLFDTDEPLKITN